MGRLASESQIDFICFVGVSLSLPLNWSRCHCPYSIGNSKNFSVTTPLIPQFPWIAVCFLSEIVVGGSVLCPTNVTFSLPCELIICAHTQQRATDVLPFRGCCHGIHTYIGQVLLISMCCISLLWLLLLFLSDVSFVGSFSVCSSMLNWYRDWHCWINVLY